LATLPTKNGIQFSYFEFPLFSCTLDNKAQACKKIKFQNQPMEQFATPANAVKGYTHPKAGILTIK
jgi:hypothetical protein